LDTTSPHPAARSPGQLFDACEVRFLRRSGPGGQRCNKTETAVLLYHRPTGVTAEANERRSQAENREVALFRLRVNLALGVRCPDAADRPPSPLWKSRSRGGRIDVSSSHADFPALLAEALDRVAGCGADVKTAAQELRCTASQLVKLLKKEPRAMALVNAWRQERNLHPLR